MLWLTFSFKTLADYDDIAVKNAYKALVDTGKISAEAFLTSQAKGLSRQRPHLIVENFSSKPRLSAAR
jgi:hypothetical protein